MKKYILVSYFFATSLVAFSQKKIEYVEYDLANGIHVILHQETSTPIVAVSVLYHVGSKNENTNKTGFAHFFEHLLFEGSENIERGEYSKIVEKNGTRDLAEGYLQYLFSPVGQKLAAKHFYRPYQPEHADPADLKRFPKLELFTVNDKFGGWAKAQKDHFDDDGSFDQIYVP